MFHGVKLAVLAAVVTIDLAAVLVLLRTRARLPGSGRASADRAERLPAGFLLLVIAAAVYVASFPWLATTGE